MPNSASQSNSNGHHASSLREDAAVAEGRRRTPWPLLLVAALLVIVPFFAWYGTWFGRELSDQQVEEFLKDEKPRHVQHALAEIERRMTKHDETTKRWYPQIVALSRHPVADVRQTAAWVMGADTHTVEFHEALVQLLDDTEPIVRWNAALSLVSFGDARGRPELLAMLRPYTINAPVEGKVLTLLNEGTPVKREGMIARLRLRNDELYELRSPLSGRIGKAIVKEGDDVTEGSEILLLAPDATQARDALIAISQVGEAEDIPEIERYAQGAEVTSSDIKQVAKQTTEAIRKRTAEKR